MIKSNENQFGIGMMCRLLLVSRSGYYAWKHRPPSVREQSKRLLKIDIKRVFDDEQGRPGSPRVARRLKAEGKPTGRHRIARIMKDNGLRAKAARKYKQRRTASIPFRLRPTCWRKISVRTGPTGSGCRTSPISGRTRAGCTWRSCLSFIRRRVIGWAISGRMTTPPWKAGTTASRSRRCMANASGPVLKPSPRCSNISKCTTIANGFIQDWVILVRTLLKPKKSLSGVSVKSGQDQLTYVSFNRSK